MHYRFQLYTKYIYEGFHQKDMLKYHRHKSLFRFYLSNLYIAGEYHLFLPKGLILNLMLVAIAKIKFV